MLTAAFARITAIILIAGSAAGCGGGGGTGAGTTPPAPVQTNPPTQTIAATAATQTAPPSGPIPGATASLWLGNVTTLGVTATVSDPAPTNGYGAWIVSNATVPTTYYVRGSYTNNGIASIQGTVADGVVSYTITFQSPASLGVGIYTDTITMHGCYDSACNQEIQDSPQSIKVTYIVQADPVSLTSISPSGVVAGAAGFTLTLTGTNFSKYSVVIFNTAALPTTFVSSTQLTATVDASMLVTPEEGSVTVESSSQENAQVSGPATLLVLAPGPDPTVASLAPSSAVIGSPGFTLTVNGANFTIGSVVFWGGAPLTTLLVSPSQLTASISASQLTAIGTTPVSVQAYSNPNAPISNAVNFTVAPVPPLTLNSVYPSVITEGGSDFTLTALGLSFAPNAVMKWNGTALATSQVSSTVLRATVPAADIATPGSASITVQNGTGVSTAALPVSIQNPSPDAVALQITADHAGAISFNSLTFPTASTWSVDLGGQPSYALIADRKVFVTVKIGVGSATGSQLVALDQASGQIVWGPIQLPQGWAFPAYDGGKVFVITSYGVGPGTLQSYDAETGETDWTTTFPFGIAFETAPTAANGFVYLVGGNTGAAPYGIDAGSGSIVWQQFTTSGTGSTPAVTAQGVYIAAPCSTDGFAPLTGASLFADSTGCEGGGGSTAVVANNVLYSLMGDPATGIYVNATTGVQLGTFTADVVPAITSTTGFFLKSGTVTAKSLSDFSTLWSFNGDGGLVTSPIVVNQAVIVGSSSGQVYALDAATGAQLWATNAGAAIYSGNGNVISGLAAGDGLLVVPAGNTLTAFTLSTNP
jgi:outer membrane protein assembly factor BamB